MTMIQVHWLAGESRVRSEIERVLGEPIDPALSLHNRPQRSVRILNLSGRDSDDGDGDGHLTGSTSTILKTHHTQTGRHPLRESMKRLLGMSPALREWRALNALHKMGIRVPEPQAWGRLSDGDEILVIARLGGRLLAEQFEGASHSERLELISALADTIKSLHTQGYRHGDLHLGNLWTDGQRVWLLDLQRARPRRHAQESLHDLAQLELSLAKAGWTPEFRSSLRERLGGEAHFDKGLRDFLRDYLRGRSRRRLRIGKNWASAQVGPLRGIRDVGLDEETLKNVFRQAENDPAPRSRRGGRIRISEAKTGQREFIVKRVSTPGLRRRIGTALRGSSAARAFGSGQSIGLICGDLAKPLAYLEDRGLTGSQQSWLILEKVGDHDLDQFEPNNPQVENQVAIALGLWLANLHAWGIQHRDLKGSNLRVSRTDSSVEFWLLDLEDLSGPVESSENARLHALSQLNASLSDEAFGGKARLAMFEAYCDRFPFSVDASKTNSALIQEIIQRSLARAHRWRGVGCETVSPSPNGVDDPKT